ncbi:MAG: TIGR03668 family PPOX class F420-dependent oxidoreductase [Chloroflexi bacterium]|nr:TIGR03668 family PPOX class F420-dependent oxidoreductase [Dehalococcoidia bacterium]MCO5203266.1 TIGR03668 family PPOX class F420-dependent oxidoreductase [Chloroflexota bacterium]MCZ7577506.1 TIGR03668 family PPOX class F420-dependent oxidoreductase [Dehalococcoidia bacterium]
MFERWQVALLQECRVARLGTIAPDGRPRLVPVCYAVSGGAMVVAVDEKPKRGGRLARLRDIARDPRVTLLVDRYEDDWTRLAWLRIEGRAAVLERGAGHPAGLEALRARYSQYGEMGLEALPLIVVTPERVVGWRWGGDAGT